MDTEGRQLDWAMFRDNLFRDILGVARAYQSDVMGLLTQTKGHEGLRLSFHPVITGLPADGLRVTELARQLGMSKQNCFQLLKPIALAGYIERVADNRDKRARKICLTERGHQLIADGAEVIAGIDSGYRDKIGSDAFANIEQQIRPLCLGLKLPPLTQGQYRSAAGSASVVSIGLMQLAQHCTGTLMGLTIDRGHSGLRLSYGQVLLHIDADGARMQDIARINDVSKQAIGQIVAELERCGYLERIADPGDGRSKILYFTEMGLGLISDLMAAARELEKSYTAVLGAAALTSLQRDLHLLYCKLPAAREPAGQHHGSFGAPPSNAGVEQADIVLYLLAELEQHLAPSRRLLRQAPDSGSKHLMLSQAGRERLAGRSADPQAVRQQLQTLLGSEQLARLNELLKELARGIDVGD